MRGHVQLIAMRKAGQKPHVVFIDVCAIDVSLPSWLQWHNCAPGYAHISIEQTEDLSRIDWRPFVGLRIIVSGTDSRIEQAVELLRAVGVERVIAFLSKGVVDTAQETANG